MSSEKFFRALRELQILQTKCFLFPNEGIKPGRSKLEETEKTHTTKNAKNLKSFFWFFRTMLNDLYQIIVRFKYIYSFLKRTLTFCLD